MYERMLAEERARLEACYSCKSEKLLQTHEGVVCTACGVMQSIDYLCDKPEWRVFEDGQEGGDPSRVGDSYNVKLTTRISQHKTVNTQSLIKTNIMINSEPVILRELNRYAEQLCQLLSLPESIYYSSTDMLADLQKALTMKGKENHAGAVTACVFLACLDTRGGSRMFEEVINGMNVVMGFVPETNETYYKMLKTAYETLLKHYPSKYKDSMKLPTNMDENNIMRLVQCVVEIPQEKFFSVVKLTRKLRDEIANDQRLKNTQPSALNSVFIYTACVLHGIKLSKQSFCSQTGISTTTLCNKENAIKQIFTDKPELAKKIMPL